MTPTPTDPREEKKPKVFLVTMRARKNDGATETVSFRSGIFACESEAHAKVAMLEGREPEFSIDELDAKPFDTTFLTAPLESTNSKLAAEIAELKARLSNEERNADTLAKELATLRAELEAARKDAKEFRDRLIAYLDSPEGKNFMAAQQRDTANRALDEVEAELNTALAAKDAAEKRLSEVAKAWKNGGGFALAEACRALTPAPTQEPPAGGVAISNDSSSTEGSAEHVANRCGVTMPVSGSSGNQAPPAVTSPNSPADVRSVGLGEWLPIETAPDDKTELMLGWKKLVCSGHWDEKLNAWVTSYGTYRGSFNPTHWQPLPPPPMLPTEGSGA